MSGDNGSVRLRPRDYNNQLILNEIAYHARALQVARQKPGYSFANFIKNNDKIASYFRRGAATETQVVQRIEAFASQYSYVGSVGTVEGEIGADAIAFLMLQTMLYRLL